MRTNQNRTPNSIYNTPFDINFVHQHKNHRYHLQKKLLNHKNWAEKEDFRQKKEKQVFPSSPQKLCLAVFRTALGHHPLHMWSESLLDYHILKFYILKLSIIFMQHLILLGRNWIYLENAALAQFWVKHKPKLFQKIIVFFFFFFSSSLLKFFFFWARQKKTRTNLSDKTVLIQGKSSSHYEHT